MSNVTYNSHSGIDGKIFIVVENYLHYPREIDLLPRESILYYLKKIELSLASGSHTITILIFSPSILAQKGNIGFLEGNFCTITEFPCLHQSIFNYILQ